MFLILLKTPLLFWLLIVSAFQVLITPEGNIATSLCVSECLELVEEILALHKRANKIH